MKNTLLVLFYLLSISLIPACNLLTPRTPEPPFTDTPSFLQPDTPERVIENMKTAISSMATQHYIRSLHEDLIYEPTLSAQSRNPSLWKNWTRAEEQTYFTRMEASARPFSGHQLLLSQTNLTLLSTDRVQFTATYSLTIYHARQDEGIPQEYAGDLVWYLVRSENGLWSIQHWIDRSHPNTPAWSDLKAAFIR